MIFEGRLHIHSPAETRHHRSTEQDGQGEVQEGPKHLKAGLSSQRFSVLPTSGPIGAHPAPLIHCSKAQDVSVQGAEWEDMTHLQRISAVGQLFSSVPIPSWCWMTFPALFSSTKLPMIAAAHLSGFLFYSTKNTLGKPRILWLAEKRLLDLCRLC